ncbi:unnamed protein product, partial [Cladocopium goreaui]
VNPDPADTTQAALALAVKRAEMFNTVHEVFVSCDDDATSCWKILIPVRFAAAEFPAIPNIPSVTWSQTSKETFRNIKVQDGAESPEGRGYIVCWCSECGLADTDYQSYVGQAGQITVKRPNAMPQAYLGLTTVMPDETPERGNPGGPVAIAFVTGDLAHYATATGQQHLVFEILPGLDDTIPGSPVYRATISAFLVVGNRGPTDGRSEICAQINGNFSLKRTAQLRFAATAMAHCAVKYGHDMPAVPEARPTRSVTLCGKECSNGEFNRSFDDRLWLFTRSWKPASDKAIWATLMIVHGTVDHSGVYDELGTYLSAKGVAVFASDMRGWGYSDGEPLYVDQIDSFLGDIVSDYQRIHQAGSPCGNVTQRFLLGKSIGGLFAAWAAAEHQDKWTGWTLR